MSIFSTGKEAFGEILLRRRHGAILLRNLAAFMSWRVLAPRRLAAERSRCMHARHRVQGGLPWGLPTFAAAEGWAFHVAFCKALI